MLEWLEAIRDLVLDAPGNADPAVGRLWVDTLERLDVADKTAGEAKCYWDLFEADDVGPERPFFVIRKSRSAWERFTLTLDLRAQGTVEVYYTELAKRDTDGDELSQSEVIEEFEGWTGELIWSCANRARSAGVPLTAIRQAILPQRTPRVRRITDDPQSDYVWAMWTFEIGTGGD